MTGNATTRIDELLVLFELALATGRSLDPQTTAKDFLTLLLARRQFHFASVWLWPDALADDPHATDDVRAFYVTPKWQAGPQTLPRSHPSFTLTRTHQRLSVGSDDPCFAEISLDRETERGSRNTRPENIQHRHRDPEALPEIVQSQVIPIGWPPVVLMCPRFSTKSPPLD